MKPGQKFTIVLLLAVCYFVNIEGGRRGFGKRFTKPSKGSSRASVKDTTSEPEHAKNSQSDNGTADGDLLKCKSFDMKLTEKGESHFKKCAASLQITAKKDMTPEKAPCFSKCIFESKRMIDENGKPHKENVLQIMSEAVPDNVKEPLKTSLGKCLDDHAAGVDPTDATCKSYMPLAMCTHMAFMEVCKADYL